MRIYLDLDGVIANFSKAICEVAGVDYPDTIIADKDNWLEDHFDFDSVFYSAEVTSHDFWANLEPFPWLHVLLGLCRTYDPDFSLLSKGMDAKYCWSGKFEWVGNMLGREHQERLILVRGGKSVYRQSRGCKNRCCGGITDFLIDDNMANIKAWRDGGGSAFHWKEMGSGIALDSDIFHQRVIALSSELYKVYEMEPNK